MRIAVLSDIHGNYEALQAVMEDMDRVGIKTAICLGDMISYGPESERCVSRVRQMGWRTVMGNHESALIAPAHLEWFNPDARRSLQKTVRTLSKASVAFISGLPSFLVDYGCRFVHGFPPDSAHTYLFAATEGEIREVFETIPERIVFVGHTHLTGLVDYHGQKVQRGALDIGVTSLSETHRYLVNIGSVGQPRDDDRDAKFVIYDTDQLTLELRRVPYDVDAVVEKIRRAGLPEVHALRLL